MGTYRRPRRIATVLLALPLVWVSAHTTEAHAPAAAPAELKSVTEQAWQDYIRHTESRRAREIAARAAKAPGAAQGVVTVAPLGDSGRDGSVEVAGGALVHHWRGRIVIPGVTLEDVLRQVRRAPRQSDVLASKILEDRGDTLRVYLKLTRKELITVTYDTEHLVELTHHGPGRASSRSVATKIAELADAGTPREREKPAGSDLGLLWRLNAYWWYEEVPGGVLVECESLSLSRGIPLLLKPFASGTVDRIARESMVRTLTTFSAQTREHARTDASTIDAARGSQRAATRTGRRPLAERRVSWDTNRVSTGGLSEGYRFHTADSTAVDVPQGYPLIPGTTLLRSLHRF